MDVTKGAMSEIQTQDIQTEKKHTVILITETAEHSIYFNKKNPWAKKQLKRYCANGNFKLWSYYDKNMITYAVKRQSHHQTQVQTSKKGAMAVSSMTMAESTDKLKMQVSFMLVGGISRGKAIKPNKHYNTSIR